MARGITARGVVALLLAAVSVCLLAPVVVYCVNTAGAERELDELKPSPAVTAATDPVPLEGQREKGRELLPEMAELYAKNTDIIAWLTIGGTNIDYPVMQTPEDEQYYLYRSFSGEDSKSGTPFADASSSLDGRNLTVYAHNMKAGTMFHELLRYADAEFYAAHRYIELTTLFERRRYEVVSAFGTRVYGPEEDAFRYYAYVDITSQERFNEYASAVTLLSEFTACSRIEPGDALLTLSTCSYHTKDGRFVVVARRMS